MGSLQAVAASLEVSSPVGTSIARASLPASSVGSMLQGSREDPPRMALGRLERFAHLPRERHTVFQLWLHGQHIIPPLRPSGDCETSL